MKKLLLISFCFIFLQSKATTWNVNVVNNQFTDPVDFNVIVGDVIHWVWIEGFHTTTSVTIPSGAATWDAPMNSTNTFFDYTVTIAGTYNYFCSVHGVAMSGSFVAAGTVPVTISAFTISAQNNKPLLSWTTQTEVNTDYFSIRRSINGSDFKEIGKVGAAGISGIKKIYSYSDQTISTGTNYAYYTVATVDKDGKTQMTPIKIYKNKNAVPKLILSLSPNPINGMGHLMLQFNADKAGSMVTKLMDTQGKIVLKTELTAVRGINRGHIHLGDIPPGIYTIYFSLDGINESYRIVKN